MFFPSAISIFHPSHSYTEIHTHFTAIPFKVWGACGLTEMALLYLRSFSYVPFLGDIEDNAVCEWLSWI